MCYFYDENKGCFHVDLDGIHFSVPSKGFHGAIRKKEKNELQGINSLAVQRLGLCTSTAGGPGSIPGWGTKIPQAARRGQKKEKEKTKLRNKQQSPPSVVGVEQGRGRPGACGGGPGLRWAGN